jgi:D-psicose/D-tagatose/L-ribulose 3-epimerase
MFKFGVDSLIWTEEFTAGDLHLIDKARKLGFDVIDINISHPERFPVKQVRKKIREVGIEAVTTFGLSEEANVISRKKATRKKGVETIKRVIDINNEIGSPILGGVFYATWGYLTGKPPTESEWEWSVECMQEAALYAKKNSPLILATEVLNRFESHFLNTAADAVRYCKEVGTGNVKVHLDTFHMIREETSFKGAVETCGKKYLCYMHVCENNRGIPGTGLVPWKELFTALQKIKYAGPLTIESFDPGFTELNRLCCIWRKFAETGEELAVEGLKNLKVIEKSLKQASK